MENKRSATGMTEDQYNNLSDQVLKLQKTLDRVSEMMLEFLDETNTKVNETRLRVGKLEALFSEVVEIFKDLGSKFNRQTTTIQNTVKNELEPVLDGMDRITTSKPKVNYYIAKETHIKWYKKLFNRKRGDKV